MIEMDMHREFLRIKANHLKALRSTSARTTLGSSVIRVFQKGTKEKLIDALLKIDIDYLRNVKTQQQFKEWFDKELSKLARTIKKLNYFNERIFPGYNWGHSTKVLTLFLRSIILKQRYFPNSIVERLEPMLYVPIDGIIIRRLKSLGIDLSFKSIKEIDTGKKFYDIQDLLKKEAEKVGIPSIWFDDNWGFRD